MRSVQALCVASARCMAPVGQEVRETCMNFDMFGEQRSGGFDGAVSCDAASCDAVSLSLDATSFVAVTSESREVSQGLRTEEARQHRHDVLARLADDAALDSSEYVALWNAGRGAE